MRVPKVHRKYVRVTHEINQSYFESAPKDTSSLKQRTAEGTGYGKLSTTLHNTEKTHTKFLAISEKMSARYQGQNDGKNYNHT